MDTRHIYEAALDVEPDNVRTLPWVGAFVFYYAPASSIRESLDRAESEAATAGYKVLDIDRTTRVDLDGYEPHE